VSLRLRYGLEAADQFVMVLAGALALTLSRPADARLAQAGLAFIALQGVGAYFVSGVTKLHIPTWRDGTLLAGILRTRLYGHAIPAGLVSPGPRARLAAGFVIAFECAFPLALLGPDWALAFCGGALLFHALNAWWMGLNQFVWIFPATYPAVIYWSARLAVVAQ
jgi:hypothetical protein